MVLYDTLVVFFDVTESLLGRNPDQKKANPTDKFSLRFQTKAGFDNDTKVSTSYWDTALWLEVHEEELLLHVFLGTGAESIQVRRVGITEMRKSVVR